MVQGNRGGGGRDGGGEGREGEEGEADGKEPKDKFYFFYLLLFKIQDLHLALFSCSLKTVVNRLLYTCPTLLSLPY